MTVKRIIIRHLVFTGPTLEEVKLPFSPGLNIVYGASNTGKSFAAKALQFMMGGSSKLPQTEEVKPYSGVWLGLTLPDGNDVTLYRSFRGGNFRLFQGLVTSDEGASEPLLGSAEAARTDTVSHLLLDAIGWSGKEIVKNASAEKTNLAIRHILPYVIVSEGDIMSEADPVHHSRQYINETMESNLLRFVLTGQDDHAAVTVVNKKTHKVATSAKLELLDEMILQVDEELGETPLDRGELRAQLQRLASTLSGLQDHLREAQRRLDNLVSSRRKLLEQNREIADRVAELSVTLQRFDLLDQTYTTDRERLESLKESGFVLLTRAERNCPVCGAPPEAQRHHHAPEEFDMAHRAASAEVRKIELEQRDLRRTMTSLSAEGVGLRATADRLRNEILDTEKHIEDTRPLENNARADYARMLNTQADLEIIEDQYRRRDRLVVRRSQIDSVKPSKDDAKLTVGIDGPTAFALGTKIAEVLKAWNFPGADQAQFNLKTSDITIAGKARADNGKGVRAILHAAFNVALLLYCRENRLPHPGFLVLDTPLLTYREPMTSRHGDLSEDEAQMKKAPVAVKFYEHLASLEEFAQIIVLENADPPSDIGKHATVQIFTGQVDDGRYGLFPFVANADLPSGDNAAAS